MDPRAVRVPLRPRIRAEARCRQPERQPTTCWSFRTAGFPRRRLAGAGGAAGGPGCTDADVPAEYRSQLGRVTAKRTLPQLRTFVENGGTVVAIGDSAANLAAWLKLPLDDHLVENGAPLPRASYFVPGSVLSAKVDVAHPIAAGMRERTDFFFDNSPVFTLEASGGAGRSPRNRDVRLADAASQRLGLGAEVSRRRRDCGRSRNRQGSRAAVWAGDPPSSTAARNVQAAVQQHLRQRGPWTTVVSSDPRNPRPVDPRPVDDREIGAEGL